ncbi:MAG: M28 family peptidase, partial [Pyrinomonadaceae bacterium]
LEAVGDDGYFQTANWLVSEATTEGFELKITDEGGGVTEVRGDRASLAFVAQGTTLWGVNSALALSNAGILKVDYDGAATAGALRPEAAGKIVLTEIPDLRREPRSRMAEVYRAQDAFLKRMEAAKAAAVISIDRTAAASAGPAAAPARLIDPERRNKPAASSGGARATIPFITLRGADIAKLYDALPAGETRATISLRAPAPAERPVKLRNVVGLLRGSDPALKDTYVILSAHYDHLGVKPTGEGDRVYNGANDDGSGTVSVIELASALSTLSRRPRRSILFMTFFGEEKGLLGSRYYGRRPLFPIGKTIAHVNLEQVGRTDDSEGPQVSTASMTGFDYSEVGAVFQAAGEATGVRVYKHPTNSDAFFSRSDNRALADQGVPAHTLGVTFEFPDYHAVGDHWEKIDYANMAKINRLVAAGLFMIADGAREPRWNEANPKTAPYVKVWRERRGK